MIDLEHDILLVVLSGVVTGAAAIISSIGAQLVISRRERKQFLKDRIWEQMVKLTEAITELKT